MAAYGKLVGWVRCDRLIVWAEREENSMGNDRGQK